MAAQRAVRSVDASQHVDPLVIASVAFLVANVLHTADHLRQHLAGVNAEIEAGGSVLSILAVLTVVAAVRHSPTAPLLAAVVGMAGAAGIAASHLAPSWSVLSDPYPGSGVDAGSWAAMILEIAAALVLGVRGVTQAIGRRDAQQSGVQTSEVEPAAR